MQDGYLDASEVAHWVLPGEVDHADNEAKHLIHETDTNKVDLPQYKPSVQDVEPLSLSIESEPH